MIFLGDGERQEDDTRQNRKIGMVLDGFDFMLLVDLVRLVYCHLSVINYHH